MLNGAFMKFVARCILVGAASLVMPQVTTAQSSAPSENPQERAAAEKDFKAGNEVMAKQKYSEALGHYRAALAKLPDSPSLLWNAGLAAYLSKEYAQAADFWNRDKKLDAANWQIRAKLIQTYQALGNLAARDKERSELIDLRKRGVLETLSKAMRFCREQFEVNGKRVLAFEYFELEGKRAVRYIFGVLKKEEDVEEFRISLGSYEDTNTIAHELGELKLGERLFHLDYYDKGSHSTYGFYNSEPSYDDVRTKVVQILEGKAKEISKMKK